MRTIYLIPLFWMIIVQEPKYKYKNYGDRREGIVPRTQLVTGEKLDLIAAKIENLEKVPTGSIPSQYRLGFYLAESARLKIEVREFEHSYKMQPTLKIYPPGCDAFKWPSKIPLHYGIDLDRLFPLSEIRGSGGSTIVPIVLFYERPFQSRNELHF